MENIMRIPTKSLLLACLLGGVQLAAPAFAQSAGDMPQTASTTAPNPAPVHPELAGVFEQFGGVEGLTALNEEFMALMLADPRLEPYFRNVDRPRVTRQLTEQFCAVLGGGCTYSGRDMVEAHAAFKIERAHFNALVEVLQVAMNKRGIPFRAQNKLLAVLAPMHREIVND
jgi:hemoglobin